LHGLVEPPIVHDFVAKTGAAADNAVTSPAVANAAMAIPINIRFVFFIVKTRKENLLVKDC
jgi:hypothetical protein